MILGLDISSNVIGVTLMDLDGTIIELSYIDLRTTTKASKAKFQDLFDKQKYCAEWFENFKNNFLNSHQTITQIHIEEALSKFTPNFSSINTLCVLFKMNFALSYEVYRIFGIKPVYWHPNTVRKMNGLKIPKGSDTKQMVFDFVKEKFDFFRHKVPDDLPKSNPWVDIADSILIAHCGVIHGPSNSNSGHDIGAALTTKKRIPVSVPGMPPLQKKIKRKLRKEPI